MESQPSRRSQGRANGAKDDLKEPRKTLTKPSLSPGREVAYAVKRKDAGVIVLISKFPRVPSMLGIVRDQVG